MVEYFYDLRDSSLREYQEKEINLYLVPIEVGQLFPVNIFFDFGEYFLRDESRVDLDRAFDLMIEYPSINIEIAGHTDSVGNDELNLNLSQQRAQSVLTYLSDNGIHVERLTATGFSATTG